MSTTLGVTRPEQASYMLRAAASSAGRAYKRQLIDLLDITPGQTVLDAADRVLTFPYWLSGSASTAQ
ncbi:hypothetical protein AB0H69_25985 [Streptomyces phaeochromogenes]|uniref:hypothetical protein n=1 Tax=Streptomyces phaeochromogenes TaxID=1923 RepID=UPI0033CCA51D